MSFIDKIRTDMYSAMKDKKQYKSILLRSTLAKLKEAEINSKKPITHSDKAKLNNSLLTWAFGKKRRKMLGPPK